MQQEKVQTKKSKTG